MYISNNTSPSLSPLAAKVKTILESRSSGQMSPRVDEKEGEGHIARLQRRRAAAEGRVKHGGKGVLSRRLRDRERYWLQGF